MILTIEHKKEIKTVLFDDEDFVAIEPRVKIDKRQQVIEIAEEFLKDRPIEMKEIFLVSQSVAIYHLKGITSILKPGSKEEIKLLNEE